LVNKQVRVSMTASAGPAKRTQEQRRQTAERRILHAAIRIISRRGLGGLTLAAAGEDAGYSRGIVSHHFGKKDDLLIAVVNYVIDRFRTTLSDTAATEQGLPTLLRMVDAYLEGVERFSVSARAFHLILTEGMNSPTLTPAVTAANEASLRNIERYLRDAQGLGQVRGDVDPQSEAVLILGGLRGVLAQWLIDDSIDLPRIRAAFIDTLKRSLRP